MISIETIFPFNMMMFRNFIESVAFGHTLATLFFECCHIYLINLLFCSASETLENKQFKFPRHRISSPVPRQPKFNVFSTQMFSLHTKQQNFLSASPYRSAAHLNSS